MTIPKGGENLNRKILLINIAKRTMGNGRHILGKKKSSILVTVIVNKFKFLL